MPPKLSLQIPPSQISTPDPDPEAEIWSQVSLTPNTPTHHSNNNNNHNTSSLQQKYNTIINRVAGYSPASLSGFSTSPSSSPYALSPFQPLTPHPDDKWAAQLNATTNRPDPPSIPSQRSYASAMYTNTYVLDAEDLTRRLSLLEPSSREHRHDKEKARRARELNRAHAFAKFEEAAALEALRQQLADIDDGEERKDLGK
ncbi:hypothetical protein F4860DRAFT_517265 [Xylaria cubensis]|nr:hypothetical protein F4860DRAFT_517265 [Xylaria cubensis]